MTRNYRLALVLLCVSLVGLTASICLAQTVSSSELQVLRRLAEERYAEVNLLLAAETYREIADNHPDTQEQARALFNAAWLLQLTGNTSEALTTLTDSLERAPSQPFEASLYNRDFELLYEQALDRALRRRHRESVSKTRAAVTEMQAGRKTEARVLLEAATALDPENPSALYNLAPESEVPAHQVAFYCFNYGDLAAASFAAGLPWLALYQAARLPGWRARSRGLLEATLRVRNIS